MARIAVLGAGTMGHAIALCFALGGHQVRLTDSNSATLKRALPLMCQAQATLAEADALPPGWGPDQLSQSVTCHADLAETVDGAELIIEAIIEEPEAKRSLYAALDVVAPAGAIWASNTSYLDIFPLVPAGRQKRLMIAHWYTPPYLVDLVDLVPGPECDPAVVETVRQMVLGLGQMPVVMRKFVSGYIANRLQSALQLEVQRLLDDGVATAEEIDTAILHGIALRLPILGVLAKADFTGVKLMQNTLSNRTYTPPPVRGRSESVDALVAAGRTGVLAGAGFYDWGGKDPAALFAERDRKLIALRKALKEIGSMAGVERSL